MPTNKNKSEEKLSTTQAAINLSDVFKETKKIAENSSNGLDKGLTKKMITGTTAYRSRMDGNLYALTTSTIIPEPSVAKASNPSIKTTYQTLGIDTFVAAKQLRDAGLNPLVANMANKISIGGGVEGGAQAQEETLFRCSNYHLALYPHGKFVVAGQHANRMHYIHPIQEFGSYYTPDVQIFRDASQNYAFIKPFSVACIAIAGYDLSDPEYFERTLCNKKGDPLNVEALLKAFSEGTKVKIQHLLEVAILHGHDSLILGAISCGAFRLFGDGQGITARVVANVYKEVLSQPQYQNRFKNVTFAVLPIGPIGEINYEIFNEMTRQLALNQSEVSPPIAPFFRQTQQPASTSSSEKNHESSPNPPQSKN